MPADSVTAAFLPPKGRGKLERRRIALPESLPVFLKPPHHRERTIGGRMPPLRVTSSSTAGGTDIPVCGRETLQRNFVPRQCSTSRISQNDSSLRSGGILPPKGRGEHEASQNRPARIFASSHATLRLPGTHNRRQDAAATSLFVNHSRWHRHSCLWERNLAAELHPRGSAQPHAFPKTIHHSVAAASCRRRDVGNSRQVRIALPEILPVFVPPLDCRERTIGGKMPPLRVFSSTTAGGTDIPVCGRETLQRKSSAPAVHNFTHSPRTPPVAPADS